MRKRIILLIDMDYFFAQIEERENPRFQGRPVVVGAEPRGGRGRGVVSTCNYLARKYGINSAMPISEAWRRCPEAIFLPVNMELYQKVSEKIMKLIQRFLHFYALEHRSEGGMKKEKMENRENGGEIDNKRKMEIVSLDEAYLDLSFLRGYKKAEEFAKKLKDKILEKEKLTATVGIGPNKLIAKMATEKAKPRSRILTGSAESGTKTGELLSKFHYGAKPDGLLIVKPEQVRLFLEPLDIQDLPGIGPKTAEKLARLAASRRAGLMRIKDLKKIPKKVLVENFGKVGESIYQKVRGIDDSPVEPEEVIKSIGKEHTFQKDTRDPEVLFGVFEKILKDVFQETKENNFVFRTITVVCRFTGFETHTKSKTQKEWIQSLDQLEKIAKNLLLKFLLENPKLIRLVGVRVS